MREYTPEEAAAIATQKRAVADRRNELANKRASDSNAAYRRANDATAGIPFGQPVLEGHYSAKRHRSALKRSDNAMRSSVVNAGKSDYHAVKAARAESWANEVERRAQGPRYIKADLKPGDRIATSAGMARAERYTAVALRVNGKSVSTVSNFTTGLQDEPRLIWPRARNGNPQLTKYLAIHAAWRQVNGDWVEVNGHKETGQ